MRVLVLGGGVIGVSTAWYLAKNGCDVTVLDRQEHVGIETSFGNCGQISPGYATPWAAPGVPKKALKWLFQSHTPLVIRPDWSLHQVNFIRQMFLNCTSKAYNTNKSRMMRLAEYSRDQFKNLRNELGIRYEDRQGGTLQLFRHQYQVDNMSKDIKVLKECGVTFNVLDPNGCAKIEPALSLVKHNIAGGLQLPGDETGDCLVFTQKLAAECEKIGVKFILGKSITSINMQNEKIDSINCGEEHFTADHYVAALGSFTRKLMKTLSINIPVYPVKGYSMTMPIVNSAASPISTVLDETYKVAITRFDQRIRVGGIAELSGYKLNLNPKRFATLEKVVTDLFPQGGDMNKTSIWTGLRPMTPDGTPIIGSTSIKNLSLNNGHGTLGWTMSLGSGKILADEITGQPPEIFIDGLSLSRYTK